MYQFIKDKDYLNRIKRIGHEIVNQLCLKINSSKYLYVKKELIGSSAKNLITQNGNNPIDLDFSLHITECSGDINDCYKIKEFIRKNFNEIINSRNPENINDSTSALTTKPIYIDNKTNPYFTIDTIDLAIIKNDEYGSHRLIHLKTGNTKNDKWFWNLIPKSNNLEEKIEYIKTFNKWSCLRNTYLIKRNHYLKSNDKYYPSFKCYIEAINEVYDNLKSLL